MNTRTANLLGALALAVNDRMEGAARRTLKRSGETPAALVVLGLTPGITNERLRRILRQSHPGAVRLVDRLVADGLVERRAGRDGREIALHLTPAGVQRRDALLQDRLASIGMLLSPLSEAEQAQLATLMCKMLPAIPVSEVEVFTVCRLCDERACRECPLPPGFRPSGGQS
jgi:DNA-binding MarR family transcriptional regulator